MLICVVECEMYRLKRRCFVFVVVVQQGGLKKKLLGLSRFSFEGSFLRFVVALPLQIKALQSCSGIVLGTILVLLELSVARPSGREVIEIDIVS